jgi:hypothetical protein
MDGAPFDSLATVLMLRHFEVCSVPTAAIPHREFVILLTQTKVHMLKGLVPAMEMQSDVHMNITCSRESLYA